MDTVLQSLADPSDPALIRRLRGLDETGFPVDVDTVEEKPVTLFVNDQEIVTMMTILDRPEDLAIGYLLNQGLLGPEDVIEGIEFDADLSVVVVRTQDPFENRTKLDKKTLTSGCSGGTSFGNFLENIESVRLDPTVFRVSWLYGALSNIKAIPTLYASAGAIHGCALVNRQDPVIYVEDVGRHNAIDKIAGWMYRNSFRSSEAFLYTTGRLTSEMVIKAIRMGLPTLVSRSGFTAWGVELARASGLLLLGRCRGRRFIALSGESRIYFDVNPGFLSSRSAFGKMDDSDDK
jgi:FdhD protein